MGRRKTIYSAEDKAKALAVLQSCSGRVNQAAKLLSIPRRTLSYWAEGASGDGQGLKGVTAERVEEKRGALKEAFDTIAERITGVMGLKLDQLEQDEVALAKVNIKDLAIAGGISTEKALLLGGSPTKITETRTDKARYETPINQMIDEMKRLGEEISREDAVRLLQPHLPEITDYIN